MTTISDTVITKHDAGARASKDVSTMELGMTKTIDITLSMTEREAYDVCRTLELVAGNLRQYMQPRRNRNLTKNPLTAQEQSSVDEMREQADAYDRYIAIIEAAAVGAGWAQREDVGLVWRQEIDEAA